MSQTLPEAPPKAAYTVSKVSNMHVAIMDYMLANPAARRAEIAAEFKVSQGWLSIVINSDAFQELLSKRQEQFFGAVVAPIRAKMLGVVDQALDRISEQVPLMESGAALETADTLLHRLGFAPTKIVQPQQGAMMQQNNYFVGSEVLNSAREKFGQAIEKDVTNGETITIEQAEGLPAAERD
jgi:hypothetical protein